MLEQVVLDGSIMVSERKIYCMTCDCYVGTLRDAKLMKDLGFLCPNCQPKPRDSSSNGFMDMFNSVVSGKKK